MKTVHRSLRVLLPIAFLTFNGYVTADDEPRPNIVLIMSDDK
ncbi:MAG: hypothetical protein VX988_11795 [Planctomycetota bacterium]|nr:hypothetical protein [Planctomycetota bacterium]